MKEIITKLSNEGWFINANKYSDYLQNNNTSFNGYAAVKQFLLNTDIRNYGEPWLDVSNKNEIECQGVLQISKIRNVSCPEIEEDNRTSSGLYKYTVSDGVTSTGLLDLQISSQLSKGVDVGSKLLLKGLVSFRNGMLLATDSVSVTCLGGKVLELIRADTVNKSSRSTRPAVNATGMSAPKFTPFGNKLDINMQEIRKFRAMKLDNNEDVDESQNTEFGEKREAALAEVRKAKGSHSAAINKDSLLDKFHGGATSRFIISTTEKQDQADSDLSALMSYGFDFTESKRALQKFHDINRALDSLLKSRCDPESQERGRGRGRRGGGRGRRNHDDSDEDDTRFDPAQFAEKVGLASRPNTTTSLAELMGGKSNSSEQRNPKEGHYFGGTVLTRGFECLAQVMNGSYEPAVVLDLLPNKTLKIRYHRSGEMLDMTAASLKSITGEKILEHMIPFIDEPLSHVNSRTTGASNYGYNDNRGGYRGRGHPSRRGGRGSRGY